MNITIPLLIVNILATFSLFWKSYFTEKGKNIATKQDIKEITDKIESVKNSYSMMLENYRHELKKVYDISEPAIRLSKELDGKLIEQLHDLIFTLFEYRSFGGEERALQIINLIAGLSKFIVGYRFRYKNLVGVEQIIDVNNRFAKMKQSGVADDSDINMALEELDSALNSLLSYLLVPIVIQKEQGVL